MRPEHCVVWLTSCWKKSKQYFSSLLSKTITLIESEPICTLVSYLALIELGQNCICNSIDKLQQGPHLKVAILGVVSPREAGRLETLF